MTQPCALELHDIAKSFGAVRALESVSLAARAGEIHAVVGDNGAGKSTMLKIVAGLYDADGGTISVEGDPIDARHARNSAHDERIAVVYQDLALVECLDVATNLSLGALPKRFGFLLDRRRMNKDAARVLRDLNVRVGDPRTIAGLLSGGQRQIVAIARAVRLNRPIILLDEPTAALGVQESAKVGAMLDRLRATGNAVVCISHDLDFVFAHADAVTVLRLGRSVGTRRIGATTRDEVIAMITGAVASMAVVADSEA